MQQVHTPLASLQGAEGRSRGSTEMVWAGLLVFKVSPKVKICVVAAAMGYFYSWWCC